MKKGISPLIAAVILIAFVIAVAGVASGFFTGFFKKRQSEISEKGETVVECGVANLEIQEDILSCSAPNWNSMVGRWHLDEGSGLTAYDSSQNSNDGTLLDDNATNDDGDDPPHWVNGKFGKALEFDGEDDYVSIKDDSSLDITDAITLEAWVFDRTPTFDNVYRIVSKPHTSNVDPWDMYSLNIRVYNGEKEAQFNGQIGGSRVALNTGGGTFTGNEWHHLATTYDGTTLRVYIDGIEEANTSVSGDISTNDEPLRIANHKPGDIFFNGTIDEPRIYTKALSQNQIEYLYGHGTSLRFPIHNKGRTSLGKKFGVTAIINGTSVSGSVSLDNSLDKAQIQTVTPLKNISTPGKLEKVRVASKACGSVYDSVEPSGVYC